ncbi:MAG: ATP-binding protein [Bacteroidota bacterium]
MIKPKISISWSGGKDSALALYKLSQSDEFEIDHLHTVFNADNQRVSMHGIHEDLIQRQADLMGFRLRKLYLTTYKTTMAYEKLMLSYYDQIKGQGIDYVMFGDIFLEDLKDFRESMLNKGGLTGIYPIWQNQPGELLIEFFDLGFEAIMCAADNDKLDKMRVGEPLSSELRDLDIDPCGENGEYHSFVTLNPMFRRSLDIQVGEIEAEEYEFDSLTESGEQETHRLKFWFANLELA